MNIDMHGKKIKMIYLSTGEVISAIHENETMWLSATYHGDRDEFWAIVEHEGKEVGRHNCKHLDSIIWLEE